MGWIPPATTVRCSPPPQRAAARLRAWLDGRDVALATQVEQIASYPEKVLADAARTTLKDAERTVKRAQTTRVLPRLGEALADGVVSGAHVDVAGRALAQLEERQRDALIDKADWLVGMAERSTPDDFRMAVAAEVRRIQADDGMARLERQRRATRLRTWVDHRDGMWCLPAGSIPPPVPACTAGWKPRWLNSSLIVCQTSVPRIRVRSRTTYAPRRWWHCSTVRRSASVGPRSPWSSTSPRPN